MGATATGWSAMGKPDFSQAAKLFYRLPADIREGMNRSEEKVLIWTLFFTWWTEHHSGRSRAIASFSETWIGRKFGRSRWTVARALAKLEEWSLLKRIRRSPKKDGTFQTNLIALSARLSNVLALTDRQVRENTPCSKSAPQGMRNGYKGEKTATFEQSASRSLSLSAYKAPRENDTNSQGEQKQVEKGYLMKLYLEARRK